MFTRRNDDDLITAYLDGQMKDSALRAFEARMGSDASLRKRVEITRQIVRSARQTTTVSAPRNFTLPRSMKTRQQPAAPPRMLWRMASGLAAAVFVIALGLDASGTLQPAMPAQSPAPVSATVVAVEVPAQAAAAAEETATEPPAMKGAPAPEGTPLPPDASAKRIAEETPTAEVAALAMAEEVTATEEMTMTALMAPQVESAPAAEVESQPAADTVLTDTAPAQPAIDASLVARMVAGLALLIAIAAGALGWLRR